ncbi:MAG: glutamyl-tRNA reductase [Candidatus Omnitrophica bacterium]|nr:glutamyl-tRNA reductase [Candidatus Omnitrophota bacterium]
MYLSVVGLNYKTASIDIREKLVFPKERLAEVYALLLALEDVKELVLLSTCNRTEFYLVTEFSINENKKFWNIISRLACLSWVELEQYFYRYTDKDAIRHLFCVASSLDSMVIGETQVLGQVKDAYFLARQYSAVGRVLEMVFEEAIRIGKKVRTETQIGKGAVSTSSAAIELARKIFNSLEQKTVMIVGAGKIGELTVKNLYERGVSTVIVANRTLKKAQQLAEQFCGRAIEFSEFTKMLEVSDIVISSTSAPHFVLSKEEVIGIMPKRHNRPLFLIDLGLPRNIDPRINDIANVYLYNIDDLKCVCDANKRERIKEAEKARVIIERHVEKISADLVGLSKVLV